VTLVGALSNRPDALDTLCLASSLRNKSAANHYGRWFALLGVRPPPFRPYGHVIPKPQSTTVLTRCPAPKPWWAPLLMSPTYGPIAPTWSAGVLS